MSNAYAVRSPIQLTGPALGISFLRDAIPRQRRRVIDFHVESGDYFGTAATVLRLIADALPTADAAIRARSIKTLRELQEDMTYLQDSYRIVSKK